MTRGANTNNLSPDQPTALFVTQAVGATLASFGQADLDGARLSLGLAAQSTLLIKDRLLRTRLTALVQAASAAMLAIDVQAIADAAGG